MTNETRKAEELLAIAQAAARAGGAELLARFGNTSSADITMKAHADYVSEADLAAERAISQVLIAKAGDFGFLGEESGYRAGTRPELWVVDPLDGTSNFIWNIPYFAVSIALSDDEGEVLGVVFDPLRDELFSAIRGQGAWLNGLPIRKLQAKMPQDAMVSISLPVPGQLKCISAARFQDGLRTAMNTAAGIRRLGSAALDLAYVGCGRLDGYFEDGLSYYDIAAGKLFSIEAGAIVTDIKGAAAHEGSVLAGRPSIYQWLREAFG